MSKRMSRREMREAGLLKPKPAPELPEDDEFRPTGGGDHLRPEDRDTRDGEEHHGAEELLAPPAPLSPPEVDESDDDFDGGEPTAAWPAVSADSAGEPAESADSVESAEPFEPSSAPSAEDAVPAQPTEPAEVETAASTADTPASAPSADMPVAWPAVSADSAGEPTDAAAESAASASSDEPEAMADVAADRDGAWANVNAGGSGVTLDAPAEEQAPSAQAPSAPSAEGEDLERPSVFDRFTPEEESDPADREELATEEGNEDFAASLRQRLRDEPPVEDGGYATEQIDVSSQASEPSSASSIVKNVLLFLVLIVVGFGLGILIGTYLWGTNSQAAVDVAETMWPLLT